LLLPFCLEAQDNYKDSPKDEVTTALSRKPFEDVSLQTYNALGGLA
jgi:hypothetical protein